MKKRTDQQITFRKRIILSVFVQIFCMFIVILKLINIQIINTDNYKLLSDKNRIRTIPLIPDRGEILDEFGEKIVSNQKIYKLILDKNFATKSNIAYITEKMAEILPKRKLNQINFNNFNQAILLDKISWEEISKLSFYIYQMPGVSIEPYMERSSKNPEAFSHLVGMLIDDPKTNILGYKCGTSGIEEYSNEMLKGTLGRQDVEVNSIGKIIRTINTVHPISGNNVNLTINRELQIFIYNLFEKEEYKAGACVVLDTETGEIKALVSFPGYNFLKISASYWNELVRNKLKPLNNRAICGLYPPGSVFKLIPAIATLENEKTENFVTNCNFIYKFGNHDFHCWKKQGHGTIGIETAISASCDIFFYKVSQILGMNEIAKYGKMLGLGSKTGIEISGESQGIMPNPSWKKSVYKKPWYPYETILSAIGQGSVLTSPIQLVKMTAIIANGGHDINVTLFKQSNSKENIQKLPIKDSTLNTIRLAMRTVCNSWPGTAYSNVSRLKLKTIISGKTGTSQVVRITKKQRENNSYKNELKKWAERDHALFVGFAPFENPKYSVAVVLEHECSGSKTAAVFAAKVLEKALEIFNERNKEQITQTYDD